MFDSIRRRRLRETTKPVLSGTDTNQIRVQQRSNILMRRIEAWQQVQDLFMPGARTLRDESTQVTNRPHPPEDVLLFLPSQIKGKTVCPPKLEMIEFRLREGQAFDALNDIRQGLRSRAYMLKFKDRFLRGQGANTRARNCVKTLDAKIGSAATRYRVAYGALSTLGPSLGQVGWRNQLRPLADEDICALVDASDLQPGEGRRRVSWIWRVCGYGEQAMEDELDNGFQEGVYSSHLAGCNPDTLPCASHPRRMVQGTCTCTSLGRRG